jgi:hypothetical protein
MFQAIQIETQSEQQDLTLLHTQRTTRCTSREFPFHGREQAFDQEAAAVGFTRMRARVLAGEGARSRLEISCLHV